MIAECALNHVRFRAAIPYALGGSEVSYGAIQTEKLSTVI